MIQRTSARDDVREHPRGVSLARAAASLLVLAGVVSVLFGVKASAAPEATPPGGGGDPARLVHVLEAERTHVASPVGLAFSSLSNSFYVVGRPGGGSAETEVVRLTPFAASPVSDRAGSSRIAAALEDPVNMAFDDRRSRLLLLDNADRLLEVSADADGDLAPRTLVRRDALRLDLRNPKGMAVDPASGVVFVLDAGLPRIVRIEPGADGSFDAAAVSEIDLRGSGVSSARGLAFDASTGHLHLGGSQKLVELTTAGDAVAARDVSALGLASFGGMAFAPSGDRTDAPGELSVYVADGGRAQGTGQIVELSLTPLATTEGGSFTPTLVRTTDMAVPAFSPPSPDPSGIGYISTNDRLIMSDGEVEEVVGGITHFQGANVWEMNRDGSVIRSANISKVAPTVVPMTDEPTGVAYRPANGHCFFTEDNGKEVFDLNPGVDGQVGTADDTWTSFDTSGVGNTDPEGIAYDSFNDRLFVADGLNREVYQYTMSGALVGHFDTLAYGVDDPETVEFNSVEGTLFVLSNHQSGPIIIETTTSGALLQTLDLSGTPMQKPAGLAYAPASDESGDKHFYVVDRGIDNNEDPNIIDGKMFELTAPPPGPPRNVPPTVDAGSDQTISVSTPASLDGTVSDDGQPNPPATVTTTWTMASGPGIVSFGDASAVDTTASFSLTGTYVLRLTGDDSALTSFDELTVNVNLDPGSPFYVSLRDAATIGQVTAANEDILFFDGTSFNLHFDGSDVGIASLRVDAFARLDADTLLLSFDADKTVPGIAGTVDDSDIVRFEATSLGAVTAGTFSLYFDGSDVGLSASGHDVNAIEPLPDGRILISTLGSVTVSGASVSVSARDEDLLAFTPTSLGDVTAGTFELYFDGSDVGLGDAGEEIDAAAVDPAGNIYMSTLDVFAVPGVSGADEDIFVFTPTSNGSSTAGTYSTTLLFDGSTFGLAANDVFAIDLP